MTKSPIKKPLLSLSLLFLALTKTESNPRGLLSQPAISYIGSCLYFKLALHLALIQIPKGKTSKYFTVDPMDPVSCRLCFTSMQVPRFHMCPPICHTSVLRPKLVKPDADDFKAQITKFASSFLEDQTSKPPR
jgi:hypothetical protein